jgi:hypothetical protein
MTAISSIENDDFCDLLDGSDETKTSACSYLKVYFTCTNDPTKKIPTSRVNDGKNSSLFENLHS